MPEHFQRFLSIGFEVRILKVDFKKYIYMSKIKKTNKRIKTKNNCIILTGLQTELVLLSDRDIFIDKKILLKVFRKQILRCAYKYMEENFQLLN